ncbi:TetR/AcrR family transcriptional regulator [Cupriavidus pauculus]|nr:TetR/AcrR family transcriptional regulator [Cupriavidus pauculus]
MMRYGSEHREKTHNILVDAASVLVRRDGPDNLSVGELMKSVGLTHGGFYYHFSSREDMLARAIERAFASTVKRLDDICVDCSAAEAIRGYVERYLSPSHRDNRGTGCPLATLTAHAVLLGDSSRESFEQGAARLTSRVAELLELAGCTNAGTLAISILCEMSGTLGVARIIRSRAQSDEMLRIGRLSVLTRVGLTEKPAQS